jgi:hypothetical protein
VALDTYRNDAACWDNNVAVNCGIGFQIYHYNNNATINGWIFSGCKNSVSNSGAVFGSFNDPWVYVNNSIVYNSPLSDPLTYTNPTTTTGTQLLNNNCSTNLIPDLQILSGLIFRGIIRARLKPRVAHRGQ